MLLFLVLTVGSILLLTRLAVGRWLLAGGCAAVLATGIAWLPVGALVENHVLDVARADPLLEVADVQGAGLALAMLATFFLAAPPKAPLVLALVPPTARWCAQRGESR